MDYDLDDSIPLMMLIGLEAMLVLNDNKYCFMSKKWVR
jgi:hypothetical protein